MHSTKTEILAHLKRNDGSTVDGIASSLGFAPMTVRQHLMALERDGAVRSEEVRRATGRPHYRYLLTEAGNRRLSDGYDRLVALLVEQVGAEGGDPVAQHGIGRQTALFQASAAALAAKHANDARGLALEAQADLAVDVLRRYGSFAEYHRLEEDPTGAIEIRDFGCVYRDTVTRSGPCAWHETFLFALLDAVVETIDAPNGCTECCRYIVRSRVPAGTLAADSAPTLREQA